MLILGQCYSTECNNFRQEGQFCSFRLQAIDVWASACDLLELT